MQRQCLWYTLLIPLFLKRFSIDVHAAPMCAHRSLRGTARLHGCTADLKWSEQAYIPTINDGRMVAMVEAAAQKLVGAARWQRMAEPTMAAEDFGFLAGAASAMQPVQLSTSFA